MKKKLIRIAAVALVLILLLSGCASWNTGAAEPTVENGILDLSDWDFLKQGNISLDGDWSFYWDALIMPGKFDGTEPTGYYTLPSGWENYKELSLPAHGVATYRLVVRTSSAAGLYSIYVPNVYTDYALWINGTFLHACGSFAQERSVYLHPQAYEFYNGGSELEIVLQVKNDALIYGGGVGQSMRLGTSEQINKECRTNASIDLSLSSICIFVGLFFLVLHRFRKRSHELVWLSILCFSVSLRNLLSNTTLLMQAFPGLPFLLGSKLVMLSIPSIIISMLFYTRQLYKKDTPTVIFYTLLSLNALYAFSVLVLSSTVYSALFVPYLLIVGVACVFGFCVSVRAVKRKENESVYLLHGMVILILGAFFDSMIYMDLMHFRYVLSYALFGFIIIQSILLSKKYAEAFRHVDRLSKDLQASLDRIMATETAYMTAQMKPHFLYNALSTIAECCETDPREAESLILSLAKYLRQTLDFDNLSGIIPLNKELELVRAYTSIERARFANIEVVFELPEPLPPMQIPPLTLQPLVENAIKHGLRKKRIGGRVVIKAEQTENSIIFTVEDNGVGISDDVLKNLVVLPSGSVSIGLYNINMRLTRLYGSGLIITSASGSGTCVSFEIPYRKVE